MLKTIPELIKMARPNVAIMSAGEAKLALSQGNGLLIDVRETAEHLTYSAVGAINIPRGVLEMKIIEIEKDAHKPIYLHCATGGRAILAAEQLKRIGYLNVTAISCNADEVMAQFKQ